MNGNDERRKKIKRREEKKTQLLVVFSENMEVNSNQLDLLLLQFEIQWYTNNNKAK